MTYSPRVTFVLAAACAMASISTRAETPTPTTDVPVREVILFSSGVGYFQHEGTVHGDVETELRFKTGQINDILKSLVLQDMGGGHVGAVTYASQDPLEKTLRSFQIDISGNPSLAQLLNQLRGAKVSISIEEENFAGTILGVEQKTVAKDKDDHAIEHPFLNLITDSGIRGVPLDDVRKLALDDAALQQELNKALAALAAAHDQEKKPVTIHFTGQGDRPVRIGYVVETPIWKASYRLILSQDADGKQKANLQGWAIVENQTDNDWKNVRLSLVSGRPISFIEDLYQPLYVPRPTVTPELFSSLRPQTYEGGQNTDQQANGNNLALSGGNNYTGNTTASGGTLMLNNGANAARRQLQSGVTYGAAMPAPAATPTAVDQAGANLVFDASGTVASVASAGQIGELFQYTVGNITLPRQTAAMIPIINDPVEVQKVSIYNEHTLAKFALNGARLTNNSVEKKAWLQGPVSVSEDGGYAGDASLGDVPAGETRLLSYGVDLQMPVQPKDLRAGVALITGKIVEGVLIVSYKHEASREYDVENKSDGPKQLIVEHPRRGDAWKLVDSPAPVETLPALYRFEIQVAPGKKEKLAVHEEITEAQRIELLSRDNLNNALYYSEQGEIPAPVRTALAKAATIQQTGAEIEARMSEKHEQIEAISTEQTRIRENLKTVDKNSAYAGRLLKKLDDQESQIERLRGEDDALREKLDAQRHELIDYLKSLTVG